MGEGSVTSISKVEAMLVRISMESEGVFFL